MKVLGLVTALCVGVVIVSAQTTTDQSAAQDAWYPAFDLIDGDLVITLHEESNAFIRRVSNDGTIYEPQQLVTQDALTALENSFNTQLEQLRTDLSAAIAGKASSQDFNALVTTVSGKADESSMASRFDDIDQELNDIKDDVANKADASTLSQSISNLQDDVDSKADTADVNNLKGLLERSWPELEDFTDGADGWTGRFTDRVTCGDLGTVLGGNNKSPANAFMAKTFELPVHRGVQIELDYIFIDSWDNERAQVYVDNKLVWQMTRSFRSHSSLGFHCGTERFEEHREHMSITLWDHTSSTLALRVTSTLDDSRPEDESFAIDNVYIHEPTLAWPSDENFQDGTASGWEGIPNEVYSCGFYGRVLGGPEKLGAGVAATKQFKHLPTHRGLRVFVDVLLIDGWTNSDTIDIHGDGVLLWSGSAAEANKRSNMCGDNAAESVLFIDVVVPDHRGSHFTLSVSSNLEDNSPKSFGITRVSLTEAEPSWPAMDDFEDDDPTMSGWASNGALSKSTCGAFGTILGGANVWGTGIFAEKVFNNLPQHDGIRLEMDFVFIDSWDSETAYVYLDGELVWSFQRSGSDGSAVQTCGGTSSTWREQRVRVDVTLWEHTARQVRVYVSTSLDGTPDDESWGIDNIRISPAVRTWPELDDFEGGTDGWFAGPSGGLIKTDACGVFGQIFGGPTVFGSGAFATKTYSNLPAHQGLRVELDFLFIDSWDNEFALVYVDGVLRWRRRQRFGFEEQCGSDNSGWVEEPDHVDIYIPDHTADSVTIRVTSTIDSSQTDESWGIDNVRISPWMPHWPFIDTFDFDTNGWTSNVAGLTTTSCSDARILGGYDVTGHSDYVEKTYTGLPEHHGLTIEFDYIFVDSWDDELAGLYVDGVKRWEKRFTFSGSGTTCGGSHGDKTERHSIDIDDHTSSSVKLRFYSRLGTDKKDESFGIDNVAIRPRG